MPGMARLTFQAWLECCIWVSQDFKPPTIMHLTLMGKNAMCILPFPISPLIYKGLQEIVIAQDVRLYHKPVVRCLRFLMTVRKEQAT
jgi:hypothetical protein